MPYCLLKITKWVSECAQKSRTSMNYVIFIHIVYLCIVHMCMNYGKEVYEGLLPQCVEWAWNHCMLAELAVLKKSWTWNNRDWGQIRTHRKSTGHTQTLSCLLLKSSSIPWLICKRNWAPWLQSCTSTQLRTLVTWKRNCLWT